MGREFRPLANSDFPVYKLHFRRIRLRKNVYSRWGARLGPIASGDTATT